MINYPELPKEHYLFTSESVTNGHPDKLCDYISDSVLDACLTQDPESKVACETSVKNTLCMVFGEITSKAHLQIEQIARQAIKEVGYDDIAKGLTTRTPLSSSLLTNSLRRSLTPSTSRRRTRISEPETRDS